MPHNQPLSCKIEQNEVVIRIGIDTLAEAAEYETREPFWPYDDNTGNWYQRWKIVDRGEWARDIVHHLNDEAEDGSSLLTDLLDKASDIALDYGSLGVEEFEPPPFVEEDPEEL